MLRGRTEELIARYRITEGKRFRLKDVDPGDTAGLKLKDRAQQLLDRGIARLAALQEMLYAQDRWSLLLIFQAMDAAGKDSTIKHVMSGVNPQGCEVHAFKQPTSEDLDHDYLWRSNRRLPERGRIGIFNRSYYEETLVVRVHPELLMNQKLPSKLVTRNLWQERFEDINASERYLARNGIAIRKFFLHVSREEQEKRFLERLDEPAKHWKFALADVHERSHWKDYMKAYEAAIRSTATPHAPWYVVPADHKWFTRLVVAAAVIETLESLGLEYPKVDSAKRRELATARQALEDESIAAPRRASSRRRNA
jgi:PPK2 family polyphosphate:nucleotide phosphotransferase